MPQTREDWVVICERESLGIAKELDSDETIWLKDVLLSSDIDSATTWTPRTDLCSAIKYNPEGVALLMSWRCSQKNIGCKAIARLVRKRSGSSGEPTMLVFQRAGKHAHAQKGSSTSNHGKVRGVPQVVKDILAPHISRNVGVGYLNTVLKNATGDDLCGWKIRKHSLRSFRRWCLSQDQAKHTSLAAVYSQLYRHKVTPTDLIDDVHRPFILDWKVSTADERFFIIFTTNHMLSLFHTYVTKSSVVQFAIDSTFKVVEADSHKLLSISVVDKMHSDFPVLKAFIHEECTESILYCLNALIATTKESSIALENKEVFFIVDGSLALRSGIHAFCAQQEIKDYTILNCYAHLWRSSGVRNNSQLGKFHTTFRTHVNDKNNHKLIVADLALIKDLNFKIGRERAIHLFKQKWIDRKEEEAVRYLERSSFTKDTKTWAMCDRKEMFVARSNQGGERNHQVFKSSLRGNRLSSSQVVQGAGMKHRKPLNEAITSMLDRHTLGSLSRAMEVERTMELEARKPSVKEIELVEKYAKLDSEYLGLCHLVWVTNLTMFPSNSFLQSALVEATRLVMAENSNYPKWGHEVDILQSQHEGRDKPEHDKTTKFPSKDIVKTQETLHAEHFGQVQSAMSSIIGQKAKSLTNRQEIHTPSANETFDAFARRVRCWTCCVETDERYWLKVRGTCEEYHDKGFCKHTLYVLRRKHLEFYNHLAKEVGRDNATHSEHTDFASYGQQLRKFHHNLHVQCQTKKRQKQ